MESYFSIFFIVLLEVYYRNSDKLTDKQTSTDITVEWKRGVHSLMRAVEMD